MEIIVKQGSADHDEIIGRAQNDDPAAIGQLYTIHRHHVYSVCLGMVRNCVEAEDRTQDVFVHLFKAIKSFRGDSSFSTWLQQLTINLVLMHMRKQKTRKRMPPAGLVEIDGLIETEDGPIYRQLSAVDRRLASTVIRIDLQRALDQLGPEFLKAILHDMRGDSQLESAMIEMTTVGNLKSRIRRARASMRLCFEQNFVHPK